MINSEFAKWRKVIREAGLEQAKCAAGAAHVYTKKCDCETRRRHDIRVNGVDLSDDRDMSASWNPASSTCVKSNASRMPIAF